MVVFCSAAAIIVVALYVLVYALLEISKKEPPKIGDGGTL